MSGGGDKTEKPTPRRRQKAREQGKVVRSRELASALTLAASLAVLSWQAPAWLGAWRRLLATLVAGGFDSHMSINAALAVTGRAALAALIPVLGAACLVAVLSGLAQGGLVLAPEALTPSFDRLNPANRLKQIFSTTALAALGKSLVPFAVIVYLAVGEIARAWPRVAASSGLGLAALVELIAGCALAIGWRAVVVLLGWAAIDYLLAWQKLEGELKMSREEIREEMKQSDGNPTSKMRVRRLQRQLRRRRMVQDVAQATVVVTNPTHFSVALRYTPDMAAPTVVAKGQNLVALEIRESARWHNIPLIENPPLAQALYRWAEVGDQIPARLYAAVAELLAFIYRTERRAAGQGRP